MTKPGIRFQSPEGAGGQREVRLDHLLLDFNGTLALDGRVLPNVKERIQSLSSTLSIHVLTSDTFGTVEEALKGWPVLIRKVKTGKEKRAILDKLGRENVVAIGNGRNDTLMFKAARLSIAIIGPEGAAKDSILSAQILTREITEALDLLLEPKRLEATLKE
jgi:P-type E1-E2 ATPase